MIRILIVDDSRLFRDRLKAFLDAHPNIEVVGEAGDGSAALTQARDLKPDIVLMDVKMEGMNGLRAAEQLKREWPGMKVIILSLYDLDAYRNATKAVGASAYVTKKALTVDLLPAILKAVEQGVPSDDE